MRKACRVVALSVLLSVAACQAAAPVPTVRPTAFASTPTASPSVTALPPDINPLTGLRVADPSLLKVPALLVSISHFPATARPQAGLSFAPFVYEYYITEGATRFLAVFYGETPEPEVPVAGNCETRTGPFVQTAQMLGNRVWLDANRNGLQDPAEGGIAGLCVTLYDADGNAIQRASTDSNGYYGFNVQPGSYTVEFARPDGYDFTTRHTGDAENDSDADSSGRISAGVTSDDLSLDAGLVPTAHAPQPSAGLPPAQVGPVRSGRLIYRYLAQSYQNSCLIYAFASEEVLAQLPQCHMVFHQLVGGGYMMDLTEMQAVAEENLKAKGSRFDYKGHLFAEAPPPGGKEASLLRVYFSYLNQSGWAYDPISRSFLRYVDTSEFDQAGVLHPDTDRLTGRQLSVQNVIVIYASHDVITPTNLDIRLDKGATGRAVLFRNGRMFGITWSNRQQLLRFVGKDGRPVALAPGHTWVLVVTPDSKLHEIKPGQWLLQFTQPPGAK